MVRPPIEEFLEICKNKVPGTWEYDEYKHRPGFAIYHDGAIGDWFGCIAERGEDGDIINDNRKEKIKNNGKFIAFAGTNAESIARYALELEKQLELQQRKFNKARELFEDYHLVWCGVAECGECIIDDCALRELGLLLYGYETKCKESEE